MQIIIGLGNPGKQYENTRHNIGFMVIDSLAKEYNINVLKLKHKALLGEGFINGKKVLLAKPQTYMNLSGESVKEILNYYKLNLEDIIVVFDDASLPTGQIRIREKGSDGGQKGVRNIISMLGSDLFKRIKVGIGNKPFEMDMADYVLSKFTSTETPLINDAVMNSCKCVDEILNNGVSSAMNKFNIKATDEKQKKDELT